MVDTAFVMVVLSGVLLAVPYVGRARAARRSEVVFSVGLAAAAMIYVVFALVHGRADAIVLELLGLGLFGLVALVGLRWLPMLLAVGWVMHVAWDLLLHPVETSGHAPWWYPVLCIGFDLFVAGFIAATCWRERASAGTTG